MMHSNITVRLQIVATAIVILGSIGALMGWTTGIISTYFNNKIDAQIAEKLRDPVAEINLLNERINDIPSWLQFQFQVQSQSDEIAGGQPLPAPPCPEGWTEKGVFRIIHKGGGRGHGGQVRVCIRARPEDEK